MTDPTPEQAEWERAMRGGQRRRRPAIIGVAVGVVTTALTAAVMMIALEANHEAVEDRLERGEVVYEVRGPRTVGGLLALPPLLGLAAGALAFKLLGGKLSAEHLRGLRGD